MVLEDRLREYVEHVGNGGDPLAPAQPLGNDDHEVWVSWGGDDSGNTHLEIRVDEEQYGYFVNGKRAEHSWEGGVNVPDVTEWTDIREL